MNIQKETKVSYFNPETSYASFHFVHTLKKCCKECLSLDKNLLKNSGISVYGTLKKPVHAKNLDATLKKIRASIQNPYIIALDSSLGTNSHVGFVTLGKGALHPGIGTGKNLTHVGDIFITGIVNESGINNIATLQTTHLATVVKLADFISAGVYMSVRPSKAR